MVLCCLAALLGTACGREEHGAPRTLGAGVIALSLPEALGPRQRPPVEFDHERHAERAECEACHERRAEGDERLVWLFRRPEPGGDREALVDLYHGCQDCHAERGAGPRVCAGCHTARTEAVPSRVRPRFSASLHRRHLLANGGECGPCHGPAEQGRPLLLREAPHDGCVGCHRERGGRGQDEATGPVRCAGCHEAAALATIARLADVPRLLDGQPDRLLIHPEGARAPAVRFDHAGHEASGLFCTTCHEQRTAGARVPERTCTDCHRQRAQAGDCAGCHDPHAGRPRGGTCRICHTGPPQAQTDEPASRPAAPPLPPVSDDFPAEVVLDSLPGAYGPSRLPHAAIVRRLDAAVRGSRLATAFHGEGALCAGCHHRTPAGTRPPGCGACHQQAAAPTADRPGLKTAYHRQCLGCHRRLQLAAGCQDCHEEGQP